jgi:hypothetical protein
MKTVAFGSCNKQTKPQDFWQQVSDVANPDLWLWLGDNVYAKNRTLGSLEDAYRTIHNNPLYTAFQNRTRVEGIWDDHDYGINDGGKTADNYPRRKELFVQFMSSHSTPNSFRNDVPPVGESKVDPQSNKCVGVSCRERGVYYYTDINLRCSEDNPVCAAGNDDDGYRSKARVIFLDTRSFRDNHFIKSLSEYTFPFAAYLASVVRTATAVFSLGLNYTGDVLGTEQWLWLDEVLTNSDADFHVIVSSIQVFTTNPVFESWGHFPLSRQRMLTLLEARDPNGVFFLSGDVHHAEISRLQRIRNDGTDDPILEITSSGLTHSCVDGVLKYVCPRILGAFDRHRVRDGDPGVFMGNNFGFMSLAVQPAYDNKPLCISANADESEVETCKDVISYKLLMNVSVVNMDTQNIVLQTYVPSTTTLHIDPYCTSTNFSHCIRRTTFHSNNHIIRSSVEPFPRLSEETSADTLANILLAAIILILLMLVAVVSVGRAFFRRMTKARA